MDQALRNDFIRAKARLFIGRIGGPDLRSPMVTRDLRRLETHWAELETRAGRAVTEDEVWDWDWRDQ